MAYRTLVNITWEDGEKGQIYLHAGKDVDSEIVEKLAYQLHADAHELWNFTDYAAVHCAYNDRWYRIYRGDDRWTFVVEHSRE
ncbi:MAG: hypothetical protein KIH62_001070 [Candidatus Kerfeldbacteria bacterium]|nr:hypothetical protein [Candidatus Kerfeldbacteria bacterium]